MLFDLLAGLLTTAVINGVVAVPTMPGLMLLTGEKLVMGNFTSGLKTTWLGWDDAAVMGFAVLMMFWDAAHPLF